MERFRYRDCEYELPDNGPVTLIMVQGPELPKLRFGPATIRSGLHVLELDKIIDGKKVGNKRCWSLTEQL